MHTYIIKPKTITKDQIFNKYCSFLSAEFREVQVMNNNHKPIFELIDFENVGEQINVNEYLSFQSGYFLGTISGMDSLIYDETKGEKISPNIYKKSPKKLNKGDVIISRNASLGKISYINSDIKAILNGGLSYFRFKNEFKWYPLAFFIVNYGAEYLECATSGGGTQQNAKRQNVLDIKIPFPTQKNNSEPKKIEDLVSLITQNILDKEEQIKLKNQRIDILIEKELKENQNAGNFEFRLPKISEIRNETRIDTGLYEKKYRQIVYLIDDYENSHFDLLEKYTAKRGQNLQITNIGLSIYSDVEKPNFYRLMTNIELTDQRTVSKFRWLGSGKKLTLIPKNTIFLSADGTVGRCMYITDLGKTITNIHPWIINRKKIGVNQIEDIFTAMFLGWLYKKGFYEKIKDKANGGGIKYNHLERYLKIPNFPESRQKEIAKEYYNPTEKSFDLNFENYLEKEKVRNTKAGIFQLNMELFSLREKLEDLVDKIVKEEKVNISFTY